MNDKRKFWAEAIARFDVSRFAIPVRIWMRHDDFITIEMDVPHRDTGNPTQVRGGLAMPDLYPSEEHPSRMGWAADLLRTALQKLLLHELDEAIHVAGVRMFDPHPKLGAVVMDKVPARGVFS